MTAVEYLRTERKHPRKCSPSSRVAQGADLGRIMREYRFPAAELARTIGTLNLPHSEIARAARAPSIELGKGCNVSTSKCSAPSAERPNPSRRRLQAKCPRSRAARSRLPPLVLQLSLYLALLQAVLIAVKDVAGEIPASVEHATRILAAAAHVAGEHLRQRGDGN